MIKSQHVTTFLLLPALTFLALTLLTTQSILNSVNNIDKGLIAYSNCAINMMNYAFTNPNQIYNFSQCYQQEYNNITLYCNIINQTSVLCRYNNEEILLNVENLSEYINYIYENQ